MTENNVVLKVSARADGDLGRPLKEMGKATQDAARAERDYQDQLKKRIQAIRTNRRLQEDLNRLGLGNAGAECAGLAARAGLGALSGNLGNIGTGLGGLAIGQGPAAGVAAAFGAVVMGADRAAKGLEVLNSSTLNAGQKADKLAEEFIPGARAFIELRKAISGVNEELRKLGRGFEIRSAQIQGQGAVQRADLAAQAELTHYAQQSRALGNLANRLSNRPPEGAIMPRGTLAEEIAFQNAQRLLPHRYAIGRAQADVSAAQRAFNFSQSRAEALRLDQRGHLRTRDEAMERLRQIRRGAARIESGHDTDAQQIAANRAGTAAAEANLRVQQSQMALEQELNKQRQLGVSLEEKKAAVRRAELGLAQAELANLQAQEQRSASIAGKIGSMTPAQRAKTLMALRLSERVGLQNLPPSLKSAVEGFIPEYAQKQYEKFAPTTALYREAARLGGKDFIEEKGDFAGLRKQIQERAVHIEVQTILNAEQMALATAKALGPILKELIAEIKVKNEAQVEDIRRGQFIRNANQ